MDNTLINKLSILGIKEKNNKLFIKYSEAELLSKIYEHICKYTDDTKINILNSIKVKYGDRVYEKVANIVRDYLSSNSNRTDVSYIIPEELEPNLQKLAKIEEDDIIWAPRKNEPDFNFSRQLGDYVGNTRQRRVSLSDFMKVVGTSFLPFFERKDLGGGSVEIDISGNPRKWVATTGILGLLGRTLGNIKKLNFMKGVARTIPALQLGFSYFVPYVSEEEPDTSYFWLPAIWKEWKEMLGQAISGVPNLFTTDFYKFTYYGVQPMLSSFVWFYVFGRYSAAVAANLTVGLMETAARGMKLYGIIKGDQKLVNFGDNWAYRLNILKNRLNLVRGNLGSIYGEKDVQNAIKFARHVFRDEIEKNLRKTSQGNTFGLKEILSEIDTLRRYVDSVLNSETSRGSTRFRFREEREMLLEEEKKKVLYGFLKSVSGIGDIVYKDMNFFLQELSHLKEKTYEVVNTINLKRKSATIHKTRSGRRTNMTYYSVGESEIPLFYGPNNIGYIGRIWLGLTEAYPKLGRDLSWLPRFSTGLSKWVETASYATKDIFSQFTRLSYRNGLEIIIKDRITGKSVTISNHDILRSLLGLEMERSKVYLAEGIIAATVSAITRKLGIEPSEKQRLQASQEAATDVLERISSRATLKQIGEIENGQIQRFFQSLPRRYAVSARIIANKSQIPIDIKTSGIIGPDNQTPKEQEYGFLGLLGKTATDIGLRKSLWETGKAIDPLNKWIEIVYGKESPEQIDIVEGLQRVAVSQRILRGRVERIEKLKQEQWYRKGLEKFLSPSKAKSKTVKKKS